MSKEFQKQYIIFDFDMTLANSTKTWESMHSQVLKEYQATIETQRFCSMAASYSMRQLAEEVKKHSATKDSVD